MLKHPIWDYIFNKEGVKELITLLRELPLFEDLSKIELVQIGRLLHRRSYQRGEAIFKEGDPGAALYIIENGSVAITKEIGETETELAKLGEKTFFGEIALLSDANRSATAKAAEDTHILVFSQVDFLWIVENTPVIASKILFSLGSLLSIRLNQANENLEKMRKDSNGNG